MKTKQEIKFELIEIGGKLINGLPYGQIRREIEQAWAIPDNLLGDGVNSSASEAKIKYEK